MPDPLSWIIISLCVIGHFFFSLSETALACCNHFKLQVEADNNIKVSKIVVKICEKYDRALTTILVLNNIVAIAISTISTVLFYNYFLGTSLSEYASLISSIIMTVIVYILGDTLPKTIAKVIPDTASKIVAYPIYGMMYVLFPISVAFEGMVKLIEKIFKPKEEETITSDDLEEALIEGEENGLFEEDTVEIIQSSLKFVEKTIEDIIIERDKIFALDLKDLTVEKLNQLINTTTYSRIPIYEGDLDNCIGILHVKSYIKEYLKNPNLKIKDVLQDVYIEDEKVHLTTLLQKYKKHHTHIALLSDKGHIVGMVTMEDVLEELVNDISEPNVIRKGNV